MEKELRKAFENVTSNNVKAVVAHVNETRKLVKEQIVKIELLEKKNLENEDRINKLQISIANIQAQLYKSRGSN